MSLVFPVRSLRFSADADDSNSPFKRKGTKHVKKAVHMEDDEDEDEHDATRPLRRGTGFPKGTQPDDDEDEDEDDMSPSKHVQ
jgi:hypothetical protein